MIRILTSFSLTVGKHMVVDVKQFGGKESVAGNED